MGVLLAKLDAESDFTLYARHDLYLAEPFCELGRTEGHGGGMVDRVKFFRDNAVAIILEALVIDWLQECERRASHIENPDFHAVEVGFVKQSPLPSHRVEQLETKILLSETITAVSCVIWVDGTVLLWMFDKTKTEVKQVFLQNTHELSAPEVELKTVILHDRAYRPLVAVQDFLLRVDVALRKTNAARQHRQEQNYKAMPDHFFVRNGKHLRSLSICMPDTRDATNGKTIMQPR